MDGCASRFDSTDCFLHPWGGTILSQLRSYHDMYGPGHENDDWWLCPQADRHEQNSYRTSQLCCTCPASKSSELSSLIGQLYEKLGSSAARTAVELCCNSEHEGVHKSTNRWKAPTAHIGSDNGREGEAYPTPSAEHFLKGEPVIVIVAIYLVFCVIICN